MVRQPGPTLEWCRAYRAGQHPVRQAAGDSTGGVVSHARARLPAAVLPAAVGGGACPHDVVLHPRLRASR